MRRKLEILLFNGEKIEDKDLKFRELKRGFLYGDGIFETLISNNFKIFRFDEHWQRLKFGSEICNLKLPEKIKIKNLILENLKKIEEGRYYIRINLWRKFPENFSPKKNKQTNYLIIIRKLKPYPEKFYRKGIRCIVSEKIKRNEKSVISRIKSFNFLENIILKIEAEKEKCDDSIVLNSSEYISEASVANIFFVRDKKLYTPSLKCGCLAGITRKIVFEITRSEKIKIEEGFFKLNFLKKCEEIFLTNTVMGIMPVREIKGYFEAKSFETTKELIEKYKNILKKEID
jgi:aminodeoxychorismate lyase